jgi:Zn-dependent peptidase ImmA (M78 family)/transcriptional regulator with XRE-family HTH domain
MGISQGDLAQAAGISQSLISQVENGLREPSREVVGEIARATAMPVRFFLVSPPDVPIGSLRFRKLSSARQGDTKRVKVLFDEAFRVVSDLLADVKYPHPDLPMAKDDFSDDDVEGLAGATREALQLEPDGPVPHLTRACERAGIAVVPLTLPDAEADEFEPVGHFGVSSWPGRTELALIGYFTGGPGDRHRHTLGHELGHLVLHGSKRMTKDPEGEASRFAGALLVPEQRAREIFAGPVMLSDLIELKKHWGVSIQALIMRGAQLGLIDEKRKGSLFKQLSARGWRRSEPVTVHREEPALVWRLLERRFGSPVSYTRAAEEIGLQAVTLRSLAPNPGVVQRQSRIVVPYQ